MGFNVEHQSVADRSANYYLAGTCEMDCPQCAHENRPGAIFCTRCGLCIAPPEVLTRACPSCGLGGRPTAIYCIRCGIRLINTNEQAAGRPQGESVAASSGSAPDTVDREKVLATITDLFGMLEHDAADYSFVSVDVAGSAELKRGQNPVLVELSFRAYHQWVAAIVEQHGGEVYSTAGDGAMCRFHNPDDAVNAARELQKQLPIFNQHQNRMNKPFVIRCGVHSGEVVTQEGMPVAQVFSLAIDVAAHLQQVAPAGTVAISEATYRRIKDQAAFCATSLVVDDERVYLWPPTAVENNERKE